MSESETKVISNLLAVQSPHVFLSIHSGTLGLFAPYAYSEDLGRGGLFNQGLAANNQENYMDVLNQVSAKHCDQCKVGSCGQQVGYLSPGTSMDYAYDDMQVTRFHMTKLQIKYSYTFEIFH
jgi:hypothetical protein